MADEIKPVDAPLSVPENATVGDEGVDARKVEPEVNEGMQAAWPASPEAKRIEEYPVQETSVQLDEFVDPTHPMAVYVPDAGRMPLSLPIHGLAARTPEQVFADDAASISEVEGDRPTAADPNPAAKDSSAPSDAQASRKAKSS